MSTGREDAKRLKPGATDGPGWVGLPLVMLRGTRLTKAPVVTAPAVTTHTKGDSSVWRLATAVAEPWATRAGQGAQDITGVW